MYESDDTMNWKVIYRDKTGKTVEEFFTAESREKLFDVLAKRSIRAVRIEESAVASSPRRSNRLFLHVAVALGVAIAVLSLLFVFRRNEDKVSKPIEESVKKPVVKTPPRAVPARPLKTDAQTANTSTNTPSGEFADGRVLTSCSTNGMYIVEMYRMPDGKRLKKYRYATKPIWKSSTDQLLHMALTTPPGVVMPPLPYATGNLTKEFEESLKTPIVINDDDSEEVREAKERIIEARETVKKLIAEGYTFEDILADHEQNNAEDAKNRNEVRERIEELKREGEIDLAREYMQKANEILKRAGITEVHDRKLEDVGSAEDLKQEEK